MAAKNKGGRPSKYRPEHPGMLILHLQGGYTFDSFAGELRVDPDTCYQWLLKHPEFAEAKKIGEGLALKLFEGIGLGLATGKLRHGNVAAWIFMMKNRYGWKDRHDVAIGLPGAPLAPSPAASMTEAQLEKAAGSILLELKALGVGKK